MYTQVSSSSHTHNVNYIYRDPIVKRDEGVSHNVTVAKNVKSYYPNWMISVIGVAIYCTLETSLLLGCVVEMHG